MHVAKRNVILLYFSKLQIQYATNFYMNLFHIIDTYTYKKWYFYDFSLTFRKNNNIIYMYYFENEKTNAKKILEKNWNVNFNNSLCI